MACLRQLAQREAKEVSQYAMTLAVDSKDVSQIDHTQLTVTSESKVRSCKANQSIDQHPDFEMFISKKTYKQTLRGYSDSAIIYIIDFNVVWW